MYIFFVRHFNDIDHITPIVWKLNQARYPASVFCMNPRYDIQNDYRMRFLRRQGVRVDHLVQGSERYQGKRYQHLLAWMNRCLKAERSQSAEAGCQPSMASRCSAFTFGLLGTLLFKIIRLIYYRQQWALDILQQHQARAIFFDHVMPAHYVVTVFLKAAQQLSIPTFTLPHGVHLYTNEATKPKSKDSRRLKKFNRFDYIVAPNQLRKISLTKAGVSPAKIFVLGSARYCDEWMERNLSVLPKRIDAALKDSPKLKMVFFPSKPQCNIDLERMAQTLRMLAGCQGIQLLVKPHTRTALGPQLFQEAALCDASSILTAELCQWADAILVVGSSVITEGLMRDKTALYLKYLHTNTTLFEELQACWIIHDESELKEAIASLKRNRFAKPYTANSVRQFIGDVVYGGSEEKDVLARYQRFILDATGGAG